jgi:hypothetical protein
MVSKDKVMKYKVVYLFEHYFFYKKYLHQDHIHMKKNIILRFII